jgi:DNA-binding transcriptional ArsR family regulator
MQILKPVLNHAERIDRIFRALADPTRRQLLERLSTGPAAVSALAEPLDMSLAAVVQHVQVLQDAGLVRSEKVGRVRTCQVVPDALQPIQEWIAARRTPWENRLDALGAVLAERPETDQE